MSWLCSFVYSRCKRVDRSIIFGVHSYAMFVSVVLYVRKVGMRDEPEVSGVRIEGPIDPCVRFECLVLLLVCSI